VSSVMDQNSLEEMMLSVLGCGLWASCQSRTHLQTYLSFLITCTLLQIEKKCANQGRAMQYPLIAWHDPLMLQTLLDVFARYRIGVEAADPVTTKAA